MINKKHIVFLGFSSFPYGFAEFQKILLISKSLLTSGNRVTVICRNGYHNVRNATELDIKVHGVYEDIEYIYASGTIFRSDSFVKRRLSSLKGRINEFILLKKQKKANKLDYSILSTRSFFDVLLYSFFSKILGFKTILNYVEYYTAMKKRRFQLLQRLNDRLFDKYAPSLVDAVFPISEFLIDHVKQVSPNKKYLKIPVLTDFEKFNKVEDSLNENYFLFCGTAVFKEIIKFILDSFALLKNNNCFYLYLVASGTNNELEVLNGYIKEHPQRDRIRIFSHLTEKQLFTYYKYAKALLIPLRPSLQDIARFPHKTGEYMASGNPVISTNYGEMRHYFRNGENILLADKYDTHLFAEKMQFVIDNAEEAKKIGLKGKRVASDHFDYRNTAIIINEFLNKEF